MGKRGRKSAEVWWSTGLHFSCQPQCGKCCDEPGGIVYLSPDDAKLLAQHHGMSVPEYLDRDCRRTLDGRFVIKSRPEDDICIYLNSEKQCEVYSSKPKQCTAYPWWGENLRSGRAWEKTKKLCPGIEAEDAILIDGETILLWVNEDLKASRGFRNWPA